MRYRTEDETGCLDHEREIPIFSGSIAPGAHLLQVVVLLRGKGNLRGYKFEQKSSHSFVTSEGKRLRVAVVAFEKGDSGTPREQRPAVRYVETTPHLEGSPP